MYTYGVSYTLISRYTHMDGGYHANSFLDLKSKNGTFRNNRVLYILGFVHEQRM